MKNLLAQHTARRQLSTATMVLLTLALLATPGPAWPSTSEGDPAAELDLTELTLEELMGVEVVYAASRYHQSLSDAPASVTIVTADQIEGFGYRNLADVLAGARGWFTTYDRNYQYSGIRGFGRPGDYGTRLLILVDGHRMNDSVYDAAAIGNDFSIDLDLVERVEIIRGPSSSSYGSNAFFAVINVVTQKGSDLDGVRLTAESASFGGRGAHLTYGNHLANGLELLVSASSNASDGQTLFFHEFADPETNGGVTTNTDDESWSSFFTKLSYEDLTLEAAARSREKGIPTAAWDVVFDDARTRTWDDTRFLALTYDHDVGRGSNLTTRLLYNDYKYDGDFLYDYGEEDEPYLLVNKDEARGTWWGTELQWTRRISDRQTLVVGGEYRQNGHQDQKNYDEEVYLDDLRSSITWGTFLQHDLSIRENLSLQTGLRFDHVNSGTEERVSPRVALVYAPRPSTAVKLLYGSAFRAPSAYELFYHDGENTTKASLELDSEEIETVEITFEQELGSRWRGLISLHEYHTEALIGLTTDPEDDLLVFANLDNVETHGAELELQGLWRGGLNGVLSYAYAATKDQATGAPLSNSPKHLAKARLLQPFLEDHLTAALEMLYMSDRRTASGGVVDASMITNLTLSGRVGKHRLRLSASAYNLFDERFADPGSEEHAQDSIEQDGRSWRIQAVFAF